MLNRGDGAEAPGGNGTERGDLTGPEGTASAKSAKGETGEKIDKSGDGRRRRWKLAALSAALIVLIGLILRPKAKENEVAPAPLPRRTAPLEAPSYLNSYRAGLDHLRRKEYGQAILDFEDALSAKKDFYPASQKLEEARALGELEAMVKRNILSSEAAAIKGPVVYSAAAGRKAYQLEGISFQKAAEGGSIGSKVAWWGIVTGETEGGFIAENPKLKEVFVVRAKAHPEIGATVEVYGKLAGVVASVPGTKSPFRVPIIDADIVDSTAFRQNRR